MSRSYQWLTAPAPPEASEPPSTVQNTSASDGSPGDVHRRDRRQQQQRLDLRLRQRRRSRPTTCRSAAGRERGGGGRCAMREASTRSAPQTCTIGRPASKRCFAPVCSSTWRRKSFIGSTERTRGTTSKLCSGGGEVVNHSSVFAFHGSGPGDRAVLERADDVDDREQDAERDDERADRRDQVVDLPAGVGLVLEDPPRHAAQAGRVLDQEGHVEADQREPERRPCPGPRTASARSSSGTRSRARRTSRTRCRRTRRSACARRRSRCRSAASRPGRRRGRCR